MFKQTALVNQVVILSFDPNKYQHMKPLYTLLFFISLFTQVDAQYRIGLLPRTSPDRGVYEKVGYTGVEITYGSPRVNNRKIWGNIVPYDEVWRAGANNATRIDFSEDVEIMGNILPRGKYALFVIPREKGNWTVIFNSDYDQWGAFSYDSSLDILAVEVKPTKTDYQESLTYNIDSTDDDLGEISMTWEKKKIVLPFSTQYLNILQEEVEILAENSDDRTLASVIYLQGAEYLERREQRLNLAQEWIDKAIERFDMNAEWNKQYYPKSYIYGHMLWTKAKLLAHQQQPATAVLFAEKMKALEGDFTYYGEENDYEDIDELIAYWKTL